MSKFIATVIESIYLIYMFFLYKTNYSFSGASFEKETESIGSMFIHNTGRYENKICHFGKIMAIIAVFLAFVRLIAFPKYQNAVFRTTVVFDTLCVLLAFAMNLNAFVYIIPIVLCEIYILKA